MNGAPDADIAVFTEALRLPREDRDRLRPFPVKPQRYGKAQDVDLMGCQPLSLPPCVGNFREQRSLGRDGGAPIFERGPKAMGALVPFSRFAIQWMYLVRQ